MFHFSIVKHWKCCAAIRIAKCSNAEESIWNLFKSLCKYEKQQTNKKKPTTTVTSSNERSFSVVNKLCSQNYSFHVFFLSVFSLWRKLNQSELKKNMWMKCKLTSLNDLKSFKYITSNERWVENWKMTMLRFCSGRFHIYLTNVRLRNTEIDCKHSFND